MEIMSLGSCCADIPILGDMRVRGPVDNWKSLNGLSDTLTLFDGSFEKEVIDGTPLDIVPRSQIFKEDSPFAYHYTNFICQHVNPTDEKTRAHLKARIDAFYDFIGRVNNDENCYFAYFLSLKDQKTRASRVPSQKFLESLNKLYEYIPAEKLIIVGTPKNDPAAKRGFFSAYFTTIPKEIRNYIEIESVCMPFQKWKKPYEDHDAFLKELSHLEGCLYK